MGKGPRVETFVSTNLGVHMKLRFSNRMEHENVSPRNLG